MLLLNHMSRNYVFMKYVKRSSSSCSGGSSGSSSGSGSSSSSSIVGINQYVICKQKSRPRI
jgi:hypothetical protein